MGTRRTLTCWIALALLLGAGELRADEAETRRCLGSDPAQDGYLDPDAVSALRDRLLERGSGCAPALVELLRERPMGAVSDLAIDVFAAWDNPATLPLLYEAFGEGTLRPHGRAEDLVFAAAGAIDALVDSEEELAELAGTESIQLAGLGLAHDRYRAEWEPELSQAGPPPKRSRVLEVALPRSRTCLKHPTLAPADPYDPLGRASGARGILGVATRCASKAILDVWRQHCAPEWAGAVTGLVERASPASDYVALGRQMEAVWGQGGQGESVEPFTPRIEERGSPWPLVVLAVLALGVLALALKGGREWRRRLAALSFGLGLIVVLELALVLVGVEPGDESRVEVEFDIRALEEGRRLLRDSRFRSFDLPRPEDKVRIAVVGASSVAGPGLAEQETIPMVLSGYLADEVPCVEVMNLGRHGFASPQIRSIAIEAMDEMGADLVVVYTGHNEVADLRERDRWVDIRPAASGTRVWARRTRLYRLLEGLVGRPAAPDAAPARSPQGSAANFERLHLPFEAAVATRFEREMTDLVRAARRRGTPVVLVMPAFHHHGLRVRAMNFEDGRQEARHVRLLDALRAGDASLALELATQLVSLDPTHPAPHLLLGFAEELADNMEVAEAEIWEAARANHIGSTITPELAAALVRVADSHRVPLVDAHAALHERAGRHNPGFDLFTDYVHLNPEGARVVARAVHEELQQAGLAARLAKRCPAGGSR